MKKSIKKCLIFSVLLVVSCFLCGCEQNTETDIENSSSEIVLETQTENPQETDAVYHYTDASFFECSITNEEAIITKYTGSEKDVVIPKMLHGYTVTGICCDMFINNEVSSVVIPNTVYTIAPCEDCSYSTDNNSDKLHNGSPDNLKIKVTFEKPETVAPSSDFTYSITGEGIKILSYIGSETNILIPDEIDGLPVIELGKYIFDPDGDTRDNNKIVAVHIPDTVKSIDVDTFKTLQLCGIEIPTSVCNLLDDGEPSDNYHVTLFYCASNSIIGPKNVIDNVYEYTFMDKIAYENEVYFEYNDQEVSDFHYWGE